MVINNNLPQSVMDDATAKDSNVLPRDVDYFDATSMKSSKKTVNSNPNKNAKPSGSANTAKKATNASKVKETADAGGNLDAEQAGHGADGSAGPAAAGQPDTLVVFYSRTGNCRKIADYVSSTVGAHITELKDKPELNKTDISVSGAVKAVFGLKTQLMPVEYRPENYSKIILITPIWCFKMCPQLRTYIAYFSETLKDKEVYLITVSGFTCGKGVANSSENDYGVRTKSQISLRLKEIHDGEYACKLTALMETLKQSTFSSF